jgi:hypothetical protein
MIVAFRKATAAAHSRKGPFMDVVSGFTLAELLDNSRFLA